MFLQGTERSAPGAKHREADKKSPTSAAVLKLVSVPNSVFYKQTKKKGETFVAFSSGKDALGDGRKRGNGCSSQALWYSTFLLSLRDSKIKWQMRKNTERIKINI